MVKTCIGIKSFQLMNCTVLELHLRESNKFGSISYCEESLTLANRGDIITEQEFIDKYNEFINKIKL